MNILDKAVLSAPLLLQAAPVATTGDITFDTIANLGANMGVVALLWHFNKRTEKKNELIEGKMEDKENKHREEMKQQQERFINLLKEQEEKSEAREKELFEKLLQNVSK